MKVENFLNSDILPRLSHSSRQPGEAILPSSFYRWGNYDLKRLHNLPKIPQKEILICDWNPD